jgi:hypothetical protein
MSEEPGARGAAGEAVPDPAPENSDEACKPVAPADVLVKDDADIDEVPNGVASVDQSSEDRSEVITIDDSKEPDVAKKTVPDLEFFDGVSEAEKDYYREHRQAPDKVELMKIQCTACWKQVSWSRIESYRRPKSIRNKGRLLFSEKYFSARVFSPCTAPVRNLFCILVVKGKVGTELWSCLGKA